MKQSTFLDVIAQKKSNSRVVSDIDPLGSLQFAIIVEEPSTDLRPEINQLQPQNRVSNLVWNGYQASNYMTSTPSDTASPKGRAWHGSDPPLSLTVGGQHLSVDPRQTYNTERFDNGVETARKSIPRTLTTVPAVLAICAPVPLTQATSAPTSKFQCKTCQKTFDRARRVDNCRNLHLGRKPHRCLRLCGSATCTAEYASIEQLKRHFNRSGTCDSCGETLSKQNMARHKLSCGR